jgi:hypothetical protein
VKPDKMTRLTSHSGKGSGSYYPSFRKDGKVMFVNVRSESGTPDKKFYSLDLVDPNKSGFTQYLFGEMYCTDSTKYNAVFALGAIWSQVCSLYQNELDPTDGALATLSLDPKACQNLVKKNWSSLKNDIVLDDRLPKTRGIKKAVLEQLKESDLLAACPQGTRTQAKIKNVGPLTALDRSAEQLIEGKCRDCHASGGPSNSFIDFTDPNNLTMDILDDSIKRLQTTDNADRMPRDETMTEDERKSVVDYLKRKKEELEQRIENGG